MQTAAKQDATTPAEPAVVSDRAQIFRRCKAAFEQIQKHGTPPDPTTYALWYAYVARTPPEVSVAVDKLLASGRALDAYELSEIHREHLTDTSADEANEAIGKEIEESIQNVSDLIKSGISQNAHFCDTLQDLEKTPEGEQPDQGGGRGPAQSSKGHVTSALSPRSRGGKVVAFTAACTQASVAS